MNRRRFLATLAGLALTKAQATASFDAFQRSQQEALREFHSGREADFRAYQQELAAALAAYRRGYTEATQAQRARLAARWGNPELSDRTRWVEYSDDQAIQRVVDFEKNEITLRLRPEAGAPNAALIRRELQTILLTDQATAFQRDPVSQTIEQEVTAASRNVVKRARVEHALVLSELFDRARPDPGEVERVAQRLAASAVKSADSASGGVTVTVPLPAERLARKAQEFLPLVRRHSRQWQVEEALVLAVMHTESAFNPMARSPVPAYGLMQIVPHSAGQDATELIYGKPLVVAPSYLYDAEKNIQLGVAYLHLLQTRYLQAITHPESRLYCAIAAYNTGAGNVARSYTGAGNIAKAAVLINQRPPGANYDHLQANLPYAETRTYLQRVVARLPAYRKL